MKETSLKAIQIRRRTDTKAKKRDTHYKVSNNRFGKNSRFYAINDLIV